MGDIYLKYIELMARKSGNTYLDALKNKVDNYAIDLTTDKELRRVTLIFSNAEDLEDMVSKGAQLSVEWLRIANALLKKEEYEYVQKCLDIIGWTYDVLELVMRTETKGIIPKKTIDEVVIGFRGGIEQIKQDLADGKLDI